MTSSCLLKVSCNVESEITSMNFCTVTLKSIGLSCTLNGSSFRHDFLIACISHLENTGSLNYVDLLNAAQFTIRYPKNVFINMNTNLIINVSKYWLKASRSWRHIHISWNSNFHLETQILSWHRHHHFSLKWQARFWEHVYELPNSEQPKCVFSCSFK